MDHETRLAVARNVLSLRQRAGWSQTELARRAKIAQTAVSSVERADSKSPRIDTLTAIASAFHIPAWILLLPQTLPDDQALHGAERLTATYLTLGDNGRHTLDTIAEAEARYLTAKPKD